jgi:hypothetical protein
MTNSELPVQIPTQDGEIKNLFNKFHFHFNYTGVLEQNNEFKI